jgi:peptidyl-dipeptidase A
MHMRLLTRPLTAALALAALALPAAAQQRPAAATPAAARAFVERAERELNDLGIRAGRAAWVAATYITDDTEALSAEASKEYAVAVQKLAMEARRFDRAQLDPPLRRKLTLLKLALSAPPPGNPAEAAELSKIASSLEADYGKGTYCRPAKPGAAANGQERPSNETGGAARDSAQQCLQINELSKILATSRDPAELLDAWQGWHRVGAPMRDRYARFVELSNKGARELGFADAGAMWRSNYDMPPDAFAKEVDRLWEQVKPLYLSLHGYVRARLGEKYGTQLVPQDGPIPAHLLGNMWAQEWGNVYDVAAPQAGTRGAPAVGGSRVDAGAQGYDLTALLKEKNVDQKKMFEIGERFFTSLGMPELPETFWERSMLVKPRDREVVCHASAWVMDNREDVRIKMCTEQTGEDLVTVHHELGHDFYYLAYKDQPLLFQGGANDGFHEAIGDAIALSITPGYLKEIGLLDQVPSAAADTMLLLRQALDKVAFLPFGLLVDQWRWKVFSGEITPANYNASWWALREKYQGVSAPVARSERDFDPGAKYHVPANTPYTRYFLARILQFQFYRALCREAGHTGPLYRCSFFGSKEAGRKFEAMMALGASKPWPEALYAMTGERTMDANAMMEYFAPLKAWLDAQNRGRALGWKADEE